MPSSEPKLATMRPSVGHDQRGGAACAAGRELWRGGADDRAAGAFERRGGGVAAARGGDVDCRGAVARAGVGCGAVLAPGAGRTTDGGAGKAT